LNKDEPLSIFKALTKKQNPDVKEVRVFDENLVEYTDLCPVSLVVENNLILKLNEEWYSIVSTMDNILLDLDINYTLKEKPVIDVCKAMGLSLRQTQILGKVVPQFIDTLNQHGPKNIDKAYADLVLRKIVIMETLTAKNQIEKVDKKLQFLRRKLSKLMDVKNTVDKKLTEKARRRLRNIFSLLFAQVLIIQYGTYAAFSWDIMEPMTCLLGVLYILIGYIFWLTTNKPYSFESIEERFVEGKATRFYKKAEVDVGEIDDIQGMIHHLETKKRLYSPYLEDVLHAFNITEEGKEDDD